MRLFIAVLFPPPVLETLAAVQQRLSGMAEKGRFVHKENLHLTLKFLGEVSPDKVAPLTAALARQVRDLPRFWLSCGGVGAFGRERPLRVVWLGLKGDLAALRRLYEAVEQAAHAAGFPPERRRFTPHVTLAREVAIDPAVLADVAVPTCRFAAEEVALLASDVQGGRRRYTPLARFLLV